MSHYRDHGPLDCKLYIGDLGHGAAKHELEDAFHVYGSLRNVWVARNPPGFAFIEYEDPRDAQDAIRSLDGRVVCGRRIRVEMAQSAKDKSRHSRTSRAPPRQSSSRSGRYGRSRSRSPKRRSSRHSRSRSRSRSRRRSHRSRSKSRGRKSRSQERKNRSRSRSQNSKSKSKSKSHSPARSRSPDKTVAQKQTNHSGSQSPEKKQNGISQLVAPGTETDES